MSASFEYMPKLATALDDAEPEFRLDVAAFRIAERLLERRCPAEWSVLRLLAAELLRRTLGRIGGGR